MYEELAQNFYNRGLELSNYQNDPRKCGILAGLALSALEDEVREVHDQFDRAGGPAHRRRYPGPRRQGEAAKPVATNANRPPLRLLDGGENCARARNLHRGQVAISVLDQGDDISVKPSLFAPERRFDTFGASLLIALDTEYEERQPDDPAGAKRNEILSYQVVAVTDDGNWCEVIFHVRDNHRMSLSEIIDETRRVLDIKPSALRGSEVRVLTHYGVAEWAALRDREELAPVLQLIRKVPVTLGAQAVQLRMNNRPVKLKLSVADTQLLAPDTNKSLGALGEVVGIEKVELPEGAIARMGALRDENRQLFEEYGITDSRITLAYYLKMGAVARDELGLEKMPLTTGAMSVATFVNSMEEREYLRMFGLKKLRGFRRTKLVPCEERELVEPFFAQGFSGGLNNATPGEVSPDEGRVVVDIDFTSAYPTAAALLPILDWSGKEREDAEYDMIPAKNRGVAVGVTCSLVDFVFPRGTRRPCIPIRHEKFGLIYPRKGRGFATGPELRQARSKGARISVVREEGVPHAATRKLKRARLAFAPFLGRMVEKRNTFLKGTIENAIYKLICNAFYGKLAQGLRPRTITSFDSSVTLEESRITCAPYATMITGIVRAALIDLQDAIEEIGGVVHSATTDGCAASFPIPADQVKTLDDIPGFWEAVLRKPGIAAMRQGLLNMGRPPIPLELKAIGDACEIWKTRGYVITREGRVVHSGKAGHQLSPEALSEHYRAEEIGNWTMRSLSGAQKIYTGKSEDLVKIESERRVNLDFDYKLIPDGANGYRPPETLEEFLEWRDAAETVRKSDRRATERNVRLNLAGISTRGGEEAATRRMFLRVIAQNLCGLRPEKARDREIAERLGLDRMDVTNAKRRAYQPLPDLPEIREIIEDMLAALSMGDREIPVELLSQVHPEA